MRILVVNNERDPGDVEGIRRLLESITAISPSEFIIKHYREVYADLVRKCAADLVILSGRKSNWTEEEMPLFEGVHQLARTCNVPLLGICAGHQLLGAAFGAKMDYISASKRTEEDGYVPVRVVGKDKILEGLGTHFVVREKHYWELKEVPAGFTLLASTDVTPIQCIKDNNRPVYGVQFHPEWYNESYPDGKVILANFLRLAD